MSGGGFRRFECKYFCGQVVFAAGSACPDCLLYRPQDAYYDDDQCYSSKEYEKHRQEAERRVQEQNMLYTEDPIAVMATVNRAIARATEKLRPPRSRPESYEIRKELLAMQDEDQFLWLRGLINPLNVTVNPAADYRRLREMVPRVPEGSSPYFSLVDCYLEKLWE